MGIFKVNEGAFLFFVGRKTSKVRSNYLKVGGIYETFENK